MVVNAITIRVTEVLVTAIAPLAVKAVVYAWENPEEFWDLAKRHKKGYNEYKDATTTVVDVEII